MSEAARAGLSEAQYELSLFYWAGRGVDRNAGEAFAWAVRAGAQGDVAALIFVSRLFDTACGCDMNRCGAMALAELALHLARQMKDGSVLEQARLRVAELTATTSEADASAARMMLADAIDEHAAPQACAALLECLLPRSKAALLNARRV